ncbi:MAG: chemotaxis protein CheD [Burkholderiales bacterium RIFCSPLOWO2_12_67_14]|nr:MAG: chemotaxis protein CheD [Burkholderiales bacterium RIFCSPLOWO2_02_FULL_67_64]OGB38605.1 MAG: chemotaxis protein CheD [Burkholderiales bacterium RIFCSPHIGHO2_12_FULL_67_38]OGB38871.1 MAG: chemotaxis protein CheD [Burkholderiales bacterium RIFCSPLOWO2_12_67_14]
MVSRVGSVTKSPSLDALKARPRKPGEAAFFFHDPHFGHDAVKVLPGEYFVTADEMLIMTVLGSCIAACIWDPQARVGGMNHFMLPEGGADTSGRYGSYAMELLINEMMKLGARRESMQAKVFGGGQVMHNFTSLNVGERNTRFVLDYLQTERIAIVSKDVLDIHPRKVCYFPASGKAMVKRLAHSHPDTLETQERKGSAAVVAKATSGGSIDLF